MKAKDLEIRVAGRRGGKSSELGDALNESLRDAITKQGMASFRVEYQQDWSAASASEVISYDPASGQVVRESKLSQNRMPLGYRGRGSYRDTSPFEDYRLVEIGSFVYCVSMGGFAMPIFGAPNDSVASITALLGGFPWLDTHSQILRRQMRLSDNAGLVGVIDYETGKQYSIEEGSTGGGRYLHGFTLKEAKVVSMPHGWKAPGMRKRRGRKKVAWKGVTWT